MELLLHLGFLVMSLTVWCCIHRLRQRGRPGFKTWPLLGAALQVSANYDRVYDWMLDTMRDMCTNSIVLPMPLQSYVFTAEPRNVEHILKNNFSNYPKGKTFHEKFEPLLGNGIFNSDGEVWKIQRKTASFEFASKVLRDYSRELFRVYALKLGNIIALASASASGQAIDIQDLFMRMTLDTICKFGFGMELGVLDPNLPENNFARAFDKCNEIISHRFADPAWKLKSVLGIGGEGQLEKHVKVLNTFTDDIIQTRRAKLPEENTNKHCDLLSRFMSLDNSTSDNNLRDMILNFIIAGRDTTASTMSWFIFQVASDPRIGANLYKELFEFHDGHGLSHGPMEEFSQLLTFEALSNLPYLQAAIMETLRLHPAVPLNFKGVVEDDVFPDGTPVKRGDLVCYSPWCMGRMESIWGSDAQVFRPERWFINGVWDFNVSPFKFTAFQAGPRICLGKDNAYLQMKITAAILCRFFSFHIAPGQVTTYRVMATSSIANGLKVSCKQRQ